MSFASSVPPPFKKSRSTKATENTCFFSSYVYSTSKKRTTHQTPAAKPVLSCWSKRRNDDNRLCREYNPPRGWKNESKSVPKTNDLEKMSKLAEKVSQTPKSSNTPKEKKRQPVSGTSAETRVHRKRKIWSTYNYQWHQKKHTKAKVCISPYLIFC